MDKSWNVLIDKDIINLMIGDSHGAGDKRINIEKHHAVLFANASITMSDFLLSVINNKKKTP